MKTSFVVYPDQQHVAADVQARVDALFARCPALCGFAVQDSATLPERPIGVRIPDADLYLTEIGIFPRLGAGQYADIFDEITLTLSLLMSEQPGASDVLRGRTFARSLQ